MPRPVVAATLTTLSLRRGSTAGAAFSASITALSWTTPGATALFATVGSFFPPDAARSWSGCRSLPLSLGVACASHEASSSSGLGE